MDKSPFYLQPHVDRLYEQRSPPFALQARTKDDFDDWKRRTLGKLRDLLGIADRGLPTSLPAEPLRVVDQGAYVEEKLILHGGEGIEIPLYLLRPKTPPPYTPILAFHGHDPSVQYILGNYPDAQTAQQQLSMGANYAQALARAGYLVLAVEQRGFGERISDQYDTQRQNACRHLSFEYMLEGRTMIGERCWDGMMALSFLQSRDDIVPNVIGCTGHSGGGTTALWLSALDERITVCVTSGCFSSFKGSILGVRHCECNYVPGILACCEMGDLAALITPRPLLFITGETDPIFPVDAAVQQFEVVKQAYELHAAAAACSLKIHPDGHLYHQPFAMEWMDRYLRSIT